MNDTPKMPEGSTGRQGRGDSRRLQSSHRQNNMMASLLLISPTIIIYIYKYIYNPEIFQQSYLIYNQI